MSVMHSMRSGGSDNMANGTRSNERKSERANSNERRVSRGVSIVHASACENGEAAIRKVIVRAKANMNDRMCGPLYTPACKCERQLVMWHSCQRTNKCGCEREHANACENREAAIETVRMSVKANKSDRRCGSLNTPACKCVRRLVMWHSRQMSDANVNTGDHRRGGLYTPTCKCMLWLVTWHPCQLNNVKKSH